MASVASPSTYVCNSQLSILTDCRRSTSCVHVDHDGIATSAFKQKMLRSSHFIPFRKGEAFRPTLAMLKETSAKVAMDNTIPESKRTASSIRKELSVLDSYFSKLQGKPKEETNGLSLDLDDKCLGSDDEASLDAKMAVTAAESVSQDDPFKTELSSTEIYLQNIATGPKQSSSRSDIQGSEAELETLIKEIAPSLQLFVGQEATDDQPEFLADERSGLSSPESFVVYVLAAVNIAVYLFGLASPVDAAGMGTSTLPVLYGAKVNELLLSGEWWRLITPMFLHSGFFHIALSSWALLFFGPQVENAFGPLAFCMIYFLGGLCGNICSFYFTPAATVGGTGPLFALFSAWVVYLWQNKRVLGEQSADYGIKATSLMGVLVICLSCLLPTDEWIHVGAILPGILFGSFAAPMLQAGVSHVKNAGNPGEPYAMFDCPSILSLSVVFALSTGLCFTIYNILAALIENSQGLENIMH